MQEEYEIIVTESETASQQEASIEDLGLEVVEDTPQLALARPTRHIRAV